MSQSAAIEISGISETSSRLSLKKAMEAFGEVVGCHMGSRGQDNPIVRYKTQDMAQSALDALKKGTVWLDGVVLTAEWKGTSGTTRRDPPPGGGAFDAGGRNEAGLDLTSRDFVTARRGGGDDRRGDDRDRDRNRSRRSRSRGRRQSRSRSRRRRRD
mmetsp:Transcript_39794/g.64307  ORF Transcript_39794/g.64307 Transcript_39794/m.64307 type:complete len:157 (-) Transcript_39794:72-542(-)